MQHDVEPGDAARSLVGRIHVGLIFLLQGEVAPAERLFGCGDGGLELLCSELRSSPAVVDLGRDDQLKVEQRAAATGPGTITVPLRDASGVVVLLVSFRWSVAPGTIPGLPDLTVLIDGVERSDSWVETSHRRPDGLGRLPREQFVGSPDLRLGRLFAVKPKAFDALDRGAVDDFERAFLLQYADGDIYNGGLHQFYSNSTGNFAIAFPAFAERIGALQKSAAVRAANGLFEGVDLSDRQARNDVLDQLSPAQEDALDGFTGEYYEADEHVSALLVAFIEQRPTSFLC